MAASPAPEVANLETRPAGELASAQIGVAAAAHDFGAVWGGEPLQHAFSIANGGQAPLEITRVVSSCGCTSVSEHPRRIEPGQTGQFAFTMDSRKLRGRFSKTVSIHSNDPRTPVLKLTLSGECRHPIEVTPASALFGKVTATQPVSRQLTVKNNTDTPLKLELRKLEAAQFDYELAEKEPGQLYELTVSTRPPHSPGLLRETLTLTTNIEAQKEITVTAVATIPQRLEVVPDAITLNPSSAGSSRPGIARSLTLTNNGDHPVTILEALADDPLVTVGVEEKTRGRQYQISVLMPAGYAPPDAGRTVLVRLDDPDQPFLLVPIRSTAAMLASSIAPIPQPTRRTGADTPAIVATQPARQARRPVQQLVGQDAPEFTLSTSKGDLVTQADLAGQVTVLNFFAPNCGFCKKQMPRLEALRPAFEAKGVRFLHVSQTMGKRTHSPAEVQTLLDSLNVRADWAIDADNAAGKSFRATGYPTMIILGKTGKIEAVNSGNIADLEDRVRAQLDLLLSHADRP